MKAKKLFFYLLLVVALPSFAQKGKKAPTLEREATFQIKDLGNNTFAFQSEAKKLEVIPIAGANSEPSFGHYWEFGDGHFSFEENPQHTYMSPPTGDAVLYLTNNYDNGELPKKKPKRPPVVLTALDALRLPPSLTYLLTPC